MKWVWRSPSGRLGILLVGFFTLVAVVSVFWTPYDPTRTVPRDKWQSMSWSHPLGTDGGGTDLLSMVMAGARTSIFVVCLSVVFAAVIGLVLGLASTVLPRWFSEPVVYLIDLMIAIPSLILALVLVAALKGSLWTVSLAIGLTSGFVLARVIRGEIARVLTQDYVTVAAVSGSSTARTVLRHVLPNVAPTMIVQLSLFGALAILSEAALSYLGLTPQSTPSWGRMMASLTGTVTVHPMPVIVPGVAVVLATLGFNLLGDGLRDAVDPRLRSGSRVLVTKVAPELATALERPGGAPR